MRRITILFLILFATTFSVCADEKKWYGLIINDEGEVLDPNAREQGNEMLNLQVPPRQILKQSDTTGTAFINGLFQLQDKNGNGDGKKNNGQKIPIKPIPPYRKQRGAGCKVTNAQLIYGAAAHAPLQFPPSVSSPAPGAAGAGLRMTGPSKGFIPGTPIYVIATSFEYHSDLNNLNDCYSEQERKSLNVTTQPAPAALAPITGIAGTPQGTGLGANANWQIDPGYNGDTRTGLKAGPQGSTLYEGTQQKIHFLDAPVIQGRRGAARNRVVINIVLIKSTTYDDNPPGQESGMSCLSGHTHILMYDQNGAPSAMNAAAATTYLDGLWPNAPAAGEAQANVINRLNAVAILRTPPANGGFQGVSNPEFRNLGCFPL
ncbi:MAG: hypothetical protein KBT63_00840 [Porticoccaceae bacterium]|nr:hypothetical protein [Porticoccaceae bacterium]